MNTILIIDDEPDLRNVLRMVLEQEGFRCVESGDAVDALEILCQQPGISMIITDYHMPRMNGLQFITQLTEHPRLNSLPVILVTADRSLNLQTYAMSNWGQEGLS